MSEKIKVCAYCRVSTNKEDQKNSFEAQKRYFEEDLGLNDEFDLYNIYADRGITAVSMRKRKEFLQMLYDAGIDVTVNGMNNNYEINKEREPKFQRVYIKDTSRLGRNVDLIVAVRALESNGVHVYFTDINVNSSQPNYEYFLNNLLNMAQQESIWKSERVRWGKYQNAKKGALNISNKLYGYDYNIETKEVTINEEQAEVIKEIYDLYINKDMGDRSIARYLNDSKVKAPISNQWNSTTVGAILKNEKYMGVSIRNRYTYGDNLMTKKISYYKRDEDEWIKHKNMPVIIDEEQFNKAQEVRKSKVSFFQGQSRGLNLGKNEFAGLIKCGNCGSSYHRNTYQNKPAPPVVYYVCSTKKKEGKNVCSNPNIKLDQLEEMIEEERYSIHITNEYQSAEKIKRLKEVKEHLYNRLNNGVDEVTGEEIKGELDELYGKKKKLLNLYLNNSFTEKELNEMSQELNEQINELEKQYDVVYSNEEEINEQIRKIDDAIAFVKKAKFKDSYSREDIIEMIEEIVIDPLDNKPLPVLFTTNFNTIGKYVNDILESVDTPPEESKRTKEPYKIGSIKWEKDSEPIIEIIRDDLK